MTDTNDELIVDSAYDAGFDAALEQVLVFIDGLEVESAEADESLEKVMDFIEDLQRQL